MKKIAFTTAYVLVCLAFATLVASCTGAGMSPEQNSAMIDLQESIAFIVKDGIFEPKELEELAAKIEALRAAPAGPGLATTIGAAAGTALLAMFPILRAIPNRFILGSSPDPEVARVAGLATGQRGTAAS